MNPEHLEIPHKKRHILTNMVKINANKILDRLRDRRDDRKCFTSKISKSLMKKFEKACEDVPVSRVIEELMEISLSKKINKSNTDRPKDRIDTSLYISESLWNEFKGLCKKGSLKLNSSIEGLMKEFIKGKTGSK